MLKYINPLTSPGEGVTVFTYPYLSAGAPAFGEAKGLIHLFLNFSKVDRPVKCVIYGKLK